MQFPATKPRSISGTVRSIAAITPCQKSAHWKHYHWHRHHAERSERSAWFSRWSALHCTTTHPGRVSTASSGNVGLVITTMAPSSLTGAIPNAKSDVDKLTCRIIPNRFRAENVHPGESTLGFPCIAPPGTVQSPTPKACARWATAAHAY